MISSVFMRLTVLSCAGTNSKRRTMWLCQCRCGKLVRVSGTKLRGGYTVSCGCLKRDVATSMMCDINEAKRRRAA